MVAIGVVADAPLPERCLPGLLAAHAAEWVAGLYAAMLRDTLDGLLSIDAARFVVFAPADTHDVLARHVPSPWELAPLASASAALDALGPHAVLARSEAPAAPIDPIIEALAMPIALGPTPDGRAWVLVRNDVVLDELPWDSPELAATVRLRARELVTLPTASLVTEPSAVFDLLEELRRHPERAPRTAHYLVTRG